MDLPNKALGKPLKKEDLLHGKHTIYRIVK
jgi:hypothetical protein